MQKWTNYLIKNVNNLTWNRLGRKRIVVDNGVKLIFTSSYFQKKNTKWTTDLFFGTTF